MQTKTLTQLENMNNYGLFDCNDNTGEYLLDIPSRLREVQGLNHLMVITDKSIYLSGMPLRKRPVSYSHPSDGLETSVQKVRGNCKLAPHVTITVHGMGKDLLDEAIAKLGIKTPIEYDYLSYFYPRDFHFEEFKPVKAWNRIADVMGIERLTVKEGNAFLGSLNAAVIGSKMDAFLTGQDISEVYNNGFYMQFNSCMGGRDCDWFVLYDQLQAEGKLEMLVIQSKNGKDMGRALIWIGDNPSDRYIDKIYVHYSASGIANVNAIDAVREYCIANGITKTVSSFCINQDLGFNLITNLFIPFPFEELSRFPYVDNMRYWSQDGLRASNSNGAALICMNQTDGRREKM